MQDVNRDLPGGNGASIYWIARHGPVNFQRVKWNEFARQSKKDIHRRKTWRIASLPPRACMARDTEEGYPG